MSRHLILMLLGVGLCFLVYAISSISLASNKPNLELIGTRQVKQAQCQPNQHVNLIRTKEMGEKLTFYMKVPCSIKAETINNLLGLVQFLERLRQSEEQTCRQKEVLFQRLFDFSHRIGELQMSAQMRLRMKHWLGGREDLVEMAYKQDIIHVMNRWTFSGTILNLLRGKRPKQAGTGEHMTDRQYIDKIAKDMLGHCDFCNLNNTAIDPFGRIYSNYSYTAANVFKLEEWHSLVIFRTHHPSNWGYLEFYDTFTTVLKWFKAVHRLTPKFVYPMIFWDLMGHAGGSQPHPHYHPFMSRHGYYGYLKKWEVVAQEYSLKYGRNYFSDLIQTHNDIGLAVRWGTASAFTPINPKKDYEFVIIAPEVNVDFINLLYFVIRAYFDDLGKYCFSTGIAYPPMDPNPRGLPAIARIMTRGSVSSVNADVTSMELFAASLVETDPYESIRVLRRSISKRMSEVA